MAGGNNKGLTLSKSRRQRDNKHYYEVMYFRVAERKRVRAAKRRERKEYWLGVGVKKNGRKVKGVPS